MRCLFCIFLPFFQRYRTLSAVAAIVFFCSALYADTTWVAGDVYGVWDTTGSPYLVTDTIRVRYEYTLEIRPGVEIYFLNQGGNLVDSGTVYQQGSDNCFFGIDIMRR